MSSKPTKPTLRLIAKKGEPATIAQISVHEFKGIKAIRGLSEKERLKKSHHLVDGIRPMAVVAAEIVALNKDELIARVTEQYDVLGPCLMWLAHAGDDARAVLDIIRAAEARLAVALANVEGDGDGDGDAPR